MEQSPTAPIYGDKHRLPVNLTLFLSLAVVVFGLYNLYTEGSPLLLVAGVGVAAYTWFTNPRQYLIYADSLCIIYGRPRVRVIPFSNVSRLEMRALATPDRLRVWLVAGRRVVLMARNPEAFYEQLDKAINEYRRAHPETSNDSNDSAPPPDTSPSDSTLDNNRSDQGLY